MNAPLLCVFSIALLSPATSQAASCSSEHKEMTVEKLGKDAVGKVSYTLRLKSKLGYGLDELRKNYDLSTTRVMLERSFDGQHGLRLAEERVEQDGTLCLVFLPWKHSDPHRQLLIDVTGLDGGAPTVCIGKDGSVAASLQIAADDFYDPAVMITMDRRINPEPTVVLRVSGCS